VWKDVDNPLSFLAGGREVPEPLDSAVLGASPIGRRLWQWDIPELRQVVIGTSSFTQQGMFRETMDYQRGHCRFSRNRSLETHENLQTRLNPSSYVASNMFKHQLTILVGGFKHDFYFSIYWECHPN
jgi:hypothetical protein